VGILYRTCKYTTSVIIGQRNIKPLTTYNITPLPHLLTYVTTQEPRNNIWIYRTPVCEPPKLPLGIHIYNHNMVDDTNTSSVQVEVVELRIMFYRIQIHQVLPIIPDGFYYNCSLLNLYTTHSKRVLIYEQSVCTCDVSISTLACRRNVKHLDSFIFCFLLTPFV
jgi:hypothetical protein